MASDTDSGSILSRFGFDKDGKPLAKSAPSARAPAPAASSPSTPAEPGSILRRFGFDAEGESLSPSSKPDAPSDTKDAYTEQRVKEMAAAGAGGLSGAAVEGMPIVGPLAQRAAAASNAAVRPLIEAANPRRKGGSDLSYSERYAAELEAIRRTQKQYHEEHPIAAIMANVAGGGTAAQAVAGTRLGGRALGLIGETLGSRAYQGALGGAAIGGTDAALRGENPIAGGGAPLGALAGFAGPVIGAGIGRAVEAGRNALRSGYGSLANLNPIAREWIANAFANETPASLAAARQRMGPQGFAADINPATTDLAAGMATRAEPPASQNIAEAYRTRQAGARQVTEDALNRNIGPRLNMEHFRDALIEERARVSDPLYQQWRTTPVEPTPELRRLIPSLERLGLTREAEEHALMRDVPWQRNFWTMDPAVQRSGEISAYPTAESWDMIKRAIDARIERAYAGGRNTLAADLVTLKNRVINEIGRTPAGPIWNQARQAFAEQSELLNQMAAGRDTFLGGRAGGSPDQLREELRGLSAPEHAARLTGVRQAADEVMGATRNGDATLRNKFLAPNNQEKLRLLLGRQRADDLIQTVEQQGYLAGQAQFVNPRAGSATAGRTGAAKALEAPDLGHWDFNALKPGTWLPPSLAHEFTLAGMLQGGRQASYAAARQQLEPVLTARGRDIDTLLHSVRGENATRAQIAQRANEIRRAATATITGPFSEALRLEAQRRKTGAPVLSGPAY